MPVPGLDHGPYLCVGFASDVIVILKDGVEIITFIKCITIMTTCKYIKITELLSPIYLMLVKCHYQTREPCYQCWWLSVPLWDWVALPQLSSFSDLGQISQWSLEG